LLLDIWGETQIQHIIDDCPTRNIKGYEEISKRLKPAFSRSASECRAKVKRLKTKYSEEKRKSKKSGGGKTFFPYWEKLHSVLGSRPITHPVASLDSMTASDERNGTYVRYGETVLK